MTDLTFQPHRRPAPRAADHPSGATGRVALPWLVLAVGLAGGAAVGLIGHSSGHADAALDHGLVVLLRFMAGLKAAVAVGAAALLQWRLRAPVSGRVLGGYLAGLAAMALAPGAIASLHHLGTGALLFHAGLLAVLWLALVDDAVAPRLRKRRP